MTPNSVDFRISIIIGIDNWVWKPALKSKAMREWQRLQRSGGGSTSARVEAAPDSIHWCDVEVDFEGLHRNSTGQLAIQVHIQADEQESEDRCT